MNMKYVLKHIAGLLLLVFSVLAHANMGSPETTGTQAGTGHFSHDIDILSEDIDIQVFETLSSAKYTINYEVYSNQNRKQVPLVFDVDNIDGKFQISVDNQPVESIPVKDIKGMRHVYKPIRNLNADSDGDGDRGSNNSDESLLEFENTSQYFLINLSKGTHNIRVNYTAFADVNRRDWTKRYRYQYALAPAKLWKSFDDLTIKIHIDEDIDTLDYTTNLGKPQSGKLNATNEWHFSNIPQDTLVFELQKQPSFIPRLLIHLNSWAVFLLSMGLLGFIHYKLIKNRLQANQSAIKSVETSDTSTNVKTNKNFPRLIVWTGIVLVPLISLLLTVLRFDFIDGLLGIHASRYHGYTIFILLFGYPIALLVYLCLVRVIFIKWIKRSV